MNNQDHLSAFNEIIEMIQRSRRTALHAVNTSLIELYWQVGAYISNKLATSAWGEGVVDQLAAYLAQTQPGLRGFTRPNLFRMRQFFETYRDDAIVSPLVRQLPWTHNLIILSQSKRSDEREFYLRMTIQEGWSKRELERQFKTALFERNVLKPPQATTALLQSCPEALAVFKDSYIVEYLDLPPVHSERELHQGLISRLKDFLIELGRDFCFIGLLLCASKDQEVVEYSLSRNLSPALVAEYKTKLPDTRLLKDKLLEFYALESPVE